MPRVALVAAVSLGAAACSFPEFDTTDAAGVDAEDDVGIDAIADASLDTKDGDASSETHDAETGDAVDGDCSDAPPDGAAACNDCGLSKCSMAISTCFSSAPCKAFVTCSRACACVSGSKCLLDCRAANPSAETEGLYSCLIMKCAAECS